MIFNQLVLATTKKKENKNEQKKRDKEIEAKEGGNESNPINDVSKAQKEKAEIEVKEGGSEPKQINSGSKVQERKKETKTIKKTKENEKRPTNSIRYDQYNHFPLISKESVRCKNEGCSKKSKVHLCLMKRRNCFTNFHHLSHSERTSKEEIKCIEVRPKHSIRFDERNHFPIITATQGRCKNCKKNKKTYIYCEKCKVHLCSVRNRNCFTNFHVLSLDEIKIE